MSLQQRFPHIPSKSWKAYVRYEPPPLADVMCALIVDPDEAEDAVREFGRKLPHQLKDFRDRGNMFYEVALQTIASWIEIQDHRMGDWSEELYGYDLMLYGWCIAYAGHQQVKVIKPLSAPSAAKCFKMFAETVEECVFSGYVPNDVWWRESAHKYEVAITKPSNAAVSYAKKMRLTDAPDFELNPSIELSSVMVDFADVMRIRPRLNYPDLGRGRTFPQIVERLALLSTERKLRALAGDTYEQAYGKELNTQFNAINANAAKACLQFPR